MAKLGVHRPPFLADRGKGGGSPGEETRILLGAQKLIPRRSAGAGGWAAGKES